MKKSALTTTESELQTNAQGGRAGTGGTPWRRRTLPTVIAVSKATAPVWASIRAQIAPSGPSATEAFPLAARLERAAARGCGSRVGYCTGKIAAFQCFLQF